MVDPFQAELSRRLAVARGDAPADVVLKGGRVLSVFTGELLEADVAISGERIAGLGRYEGIESVDVSGLIMLPGFLDAHMHLESTKLTPAEFARAALPWGTTTVVADPHEIANVLGVEGIRALLAAADRVPLDIYAMVSSCVPASPLESGGAEISPADIESLLRHEPRAIGLAEMMSVPDVVRGAPDALAKLGAARASGRFHVDGHAPRLSGRDLNAYVAAGVASDHECTTVEEALEKRRLGMWIMIREGSAAKNLEALAPMVRDLGPANCLLCTDDREPDELVATGHINGVVRKAVTLGIPPADAVTMATLSAARYHRLLDRGAVAPGLLADVIAVRDLAEFRPVRVWKRGRLVATDGRAVDVPAAPLPDWMRDTVRVAMPFEHDRLRVAAHGPIRVIGVQPGQIVTRALIDDPTIVDGEAVADASRDLAKVAVIERHRGTGRTGVGFVRGFGIRRGALASTHAHDAHNVVVVGIDDDDMAAAVEELARIGGGQVAVREGRAIGALACPYAGLLSEEPAEVVAAQAAALATAARELGVTIPSPFMAMSFLALSVVPELKITDRGLVDTIGFQVVPLAAPHRAPTEAGRAS